MNRYLFITISLLIFIFSGCEKKEKLWPKIIVPAGIQTQIFGLGENYENQIWFNIADQKTWSNFHSNWEIAFGSGPNNEIVINGGKNGNIGVHEFAMSRYNDFTKVNISGIPALDWKFDNPSGQADSMAFNAWCNPNGSGGFLGKNSLYLIDRGDDSMGNKRYIQLILHSRIGGNYHFSWNYALDTAQAKHDVYINPSLSKNYVYYNFGKADTVENEPTTNNNWDLVFTTYKKFIPDPSNGNKPYPYVLRGVLYNPNGVKVYDVPNVGLNTWEQLDLLYAKSITCSTIRDEIGYDWKIWNMSANKYTMANKIYIIKDTKDNYFKFKFVDFYDDNGKKGYPKMAWELLK